MTRRELAGDSGVYLALFLVAVAGLLRQPALLLLGAILLALFGMTALWRRYCLARVEYRRLLGETRAFPGDTVDLRIQIVNRKLLPLPWLEIDDELPDALSLEGVPLSPSHKSFRTRLRNLLSLRWYERVTRRYTIRCHSRGYHELGPAVIRSGDVFGFFSREETLPRLDHVLVYPRILTLAELGVPSRQLFGPRRTPDRLLEDPLRVAGVREYLPGDSPRRIHWKASARLGALQVKVLDPGAALDLAIFLNVSTVLPEWAGSIPELLEEAISVAASVAYDGIGRGCRVGLYANTSATGSDQQVRLPPAGDSEQLLRILETLAKINGFPITSIDRLLQRESRNLPWGATVLLVSAATSEAALAALVRLRRAGHRVALLRIGDLALPAGLTGIDVIHPRAGALAG